MVIFLQYTLTDTRCFGKAKAGLLPAPAWPSPQPIKEFMRGSGPIIERGRLGLNNWIGENFICKVRRGIRVKDRIDTGAGIWLKNAARHQYSSEYFVLTKYEFVFAARKQWPVINYSSLEQLVKTLFETEVQIRDEHYQYTSTTFRQLHQHLKRFHIVNSTRKAQIDFDTQLPLIKDCTPQLYVYLDKNEKFDAAGKKINAVTGNSSVPFKLYGFWHKYSNHPVRVWIHERQSTQSLIEQNRNLRISILRFHSEYQCLNNIFRSIQKGEIKVDPFSDQSHILQDYLSNAISTILKDQRAVNGQQETNDWVGYFTSIFSQLQPGELDILKGRIKQFNFRPHAERTAIAYITNQYQTTEVMGDNFNISNSQVGAAGSNAKAENNTFQQTNYTIPADLDFVKLQEELGELKQQLKLNAETAEELDAVKNVAAAEAEAKKSNGNGVVKFLKAGGQWVLDTATKIGVSVVTELLKKNMGI